MKYTKTSIGKISYIKFTKDLTYKQALKKIPKTVRMMKCWEFLKLISEEFEVFNEFPKQDYFCYFNKEYFKSCSLSNFANNFNVNANYWDVDCSYYRLRGVLIVKK